MKLPDCIGQTIVENGSVMASPLLGTDNFIKFCKERKLSINRKRLIRFERMGLFAPMFRLRTPDDDSPQFIIPIREDNNWFIKTWAWDATSTPYTHVIPDYKDQTQEGYYSKFQIFHLKNILARMTLSLSLDDFIERENDKKVNWNKEGTSWTEYAESSINILKKDEFYHSVAMLCQYISNRYYGQSQSNQRTITIPQNSYSDKWISVLGNKWDWYEEVNNWNVKIVENIFDLTPYNLRNAYERMSIDQETCDPLDKWYKLVQFVSVNKRKKLKGDALLAETLRSAAYMLRLLYKDLYGDELPHPNEVTGKILTQIPELDVHEDSRRYLELVVNQFEINPQPKIALIVEGQSEKVAILKIFNEYYGTHIGKYGIEVIVLGGVNIATGSKKDDRFRAILRLIDYLHHHQTITYLILDNENYAKKLEVEAGKAKSIHNNQRYITKSEYIQIWKDSFEFDNFSSDEISDALNTLSNVESLFSQKEINYCRGNRDSGACLTKLYSNKINYGLPKIKLNEILVENMMSDSTVKNIKERPIIKMMTNVVELSVKNNFPTSEEIYENNQLSDYVGKVNKD